jgi:hypothetical protein
MVCHKKERELQQYLQEGNRQEPTPQISTAHAMRGRHTYIPVTF